MNKGYVTAIAALLVCATPLMAAVAPQGVSNMGNVRGGDALPAKRIIEIKCTTCHSSKLIEDAMLANKDMEKIQMEMEKKGAKLNANERDVLGIYWKQQNPLKKNKK